MKILFLDIDGVLNSERHRETVIVNRLLADENSIDSEAVKILQSLVEEYSDLRIVISSSWRKICSIAELKAMLQDKGLDSSKIIEYTPVIHNTQRGEEIKSWLKGQFIKSNFPVHQFVILDDDDDMGSLKNHLIQTDYKVGITLSDVDKIKDFFKKQPLMKDEELFS